MQPAFHRQSISEHAEMITSYGKKFAALWKDGDTRDEIPGPGEGVGSRFMTRFGTKS